MNIIHHWNPPTQGRTPRIRKRGEVRAGWWPHSGGQAIPPRCREYLRRLEWQFAGGQPVRLAA
jgi:hypothetical protein